MKKLWLAAIVVLNYSPLLAQHSLEKLWESDSLTLKGPESALFDSESKSLYVSSMGSGSIVRIDLDGKVINGSFELSRENLLTSDGRKIFLSAGEKGYTFKFEDPFIEINKKLANQLQLMSGHLTEQVLSTTEQGQTGFERVIALKEVIITGRKDDLIYGINGKGPNVCGDFVCLMKILNCKNHFNHRFNIPPVEGEIYFDGNQMTESLVIPSQLPKIIYAGCITDVNNTLFKLNGIYTTREFYTLNSDQITSPEPQFLSTMFWRPGIVTDEKGEAEFSFFTGDITGKYRIIIQGISDTDFIFVQKELEVR